jgi:hypothetical protein
MGTTAFSWSGLSVVALAGVLTAATPSVASSGDAPLPESELTQIRALRTDGRYQEAEDAARALLDRLGKQSGSTSMAIAGVLDELVAVLYDNGRRLDEASLALARRAVELRRNQPTDAFGSNTATSGGDPRPKPSKRPSSFAFVNGAGETPQPPTLWKRSPT